MSELAIWEAIQSLEAKIDRVLEAVNLILLIEVSDDPDTDDLEHTEAQGNA